MKRGNFVKEIAEERIAILYRLAEEQAQNDTGLSKDYIRTLKRISEHYKVRIPKGIDDRICKHCNLVLIPGLTASVRLASSRGYVVYKCSGCKRERHVFYKDCRDYSMRPPADPF